MDFLVTNMQAGQKENACASKKSLKVKLGIGLPHRMFCTDSRLSKTPGTALSLLSKSPAWSGFLLVCLSEAI